MKSKFLLIIIACTLIFGCKEDLNDIPQEEEILTGTNFQLDYVDNITFTSDDGLLISGRSGDKYTLIKTDKNLNVEWTKNNYEWGDIFFGGWGSSMHHCKMLKVFQMDNGQNLCFLSITEGGDIVISSTLIILLEQNGNQVQELEIDNILTSNVVKTEDGGYILFGPGTTIKLDKNFNILWTKRFGDDIYSPSQITSISNNGFAITGVDKARGQTYLKKYDSNGNELLSKNYKNISRPLMGDRLNFLQLADNGFFIVGRACQIIRTNDIGDTIWTRRFEYSEDSQFEHIISQNSNELIIEGTIGNSNENQKSTLIKINENGQLLDSLTERKFEMIVYSPLDTYIKAIEIDSTHINLTKYNEDNLFKKE